MRDIDGTGASWADPPGPTTCDAAMVPGWYYAAKAMLRRIRAGYVDASALDCEQMLLLEVIETDQALCRMQQAEASAKGYGSAAERKAVESQRAKIGEIVGW